MNDSEISLAEVPPNTLISLVQKGLKYVQIESNLKKDIIQAREREKEKLKKQAEEQEEDEKGENKADVDQSEEKIEQEVVPSTNVTVTISEDDNKNFKQDLVKSIEAVVPSMSTDDITPSINTPEVKISNENIGNHSKMEVEKHADEKLTGSNPNLVTKQEVVSPQSDKDVFQETMSRMTDWVSSDAEQKKLNPSDSADLS